MKTFARISLIAILAGIITGCDPVVTGKRISDDTYTISATDNTVNNNPNIALNTMGVDALERCHNGFKKTSENTALLPGSSYRQVHTWVIKCLP
jgi:hypothetical protein